MFEEYLVGTGLTDASYEEPLPGSLKVPDYQVLWHSRPHLFEVKGFDPEVAPDFGCFDLYPPIRKKITKAVEKFKDLEAYPCSLVLHYAGPGLVFLEPQLILGAMLGKVAFEIPLAADGSGLDDSQVRNVFTTGGKMLRYAKGGPPVEPQNTTINAIIVVERLSRRTEQILIALRQPEEDCGTQAKRRGVLDRGRALPWNGSRRVTVPPYAASSTKTPLRECPCRGTSSWARTTSDTVQMARVGSAARSQEPR